MRARAHSHVTRRLYYKKICKKGNIWLTTMPCLRLILVLNFSYIAAMDGSIESEEARCHCGHLVAKLRKAGVELKCKRCKRILLIPFGGNPARLSPLNTRRSL